MSNPTDKLLTFLFLWVTYPSGQKIVGYPIYRSVGEFYLLEVALMKGLIYIWFREDFNLNANDFSQRVDLGTCKYYCLPRQRSVKSKVKEGR